MDAISVSATKESWIWMTEHCIRAKLKESLRGLELLSFKV